MRLHAVAFSLTPATDLVPPPRSTDLSRLGQARRRRRALLPLLPRGHRAHPSALPRRAHPPLALSPATRTLADVAALGARDVRKLKMEPPLQDEDAVEYRKGERRDVEVLETGVGY